MAGSKTDADSAARSSEVGSAPLLLASVPAFTQMTTPDSKRAWDAQMQEWSDRLREWQRDQGDHEDQDHDDHSHQQDAEHAQPELAERPLADRWQPSAEFDQYLLLRMRMLQHQRFCARRIL
jgi:hypothetical protein